MSEQRATRPVKVILGEALDELRVREERLAQLEAETAEVRAAIRALSRLIGEAKHPKPTTQNAAKGDTREAIVKAVADSPDPMNMQEIAKAIGRDPAGWLSAQIAALVRGGSLSEITPGRFGIPPQFRTEEEEAA